MKLKLLVIGLVFICTAAMGAQSSDLYRVEWPVADRSQSAYQQALLAAFKEVVVRSSGTQRALEAFYVQESYKKLASFIRTYQYQPLPKSEDPEAPTLQLVFHFDGNAVRRLLQDAAVPMWSGSQPVTLMWIAYEDNFERKVLNTGTSAEEPVLLSVMEQIKRRGLPVVLPLMDLEDEIQVTSADIWGLFPDPILAASQRYGSDSVLAGRLVNQGVNWRGRFMLSVDNQQLYRDFESETQDGLLQQAIDWLGESLCDVYCVAESFTLNQWRLLIQDVGSFYSYRKLMDYLESLSAIRRVELSQLKGRSVMVSVDLVGEVDSLIQAIALDRKLIPVNDSQQVIQALEAINKKAQPPQAENELMTMDMENPQTAPSAKGITTDNSAVQPVPAQADPLQNLLVYYWRP